MPIQLLACCELHDNAGASVEDDDAAYDLEEGDNPGEDSYPVDEILKHMAITGYSDMSQTRST